MTDINQSIAHARSLAAQDQQIGGVHWYAFMLLASFIEKDEVRAQLEQFLFDSRPENSINTV